MHTSVAVPFLVAVLQQQGLTAVSEQLVRNVIWKLQVYLPHAISEGEPSAGVSPYLKQLQVLRPDIPTVRLAPRLGRCAYCLTVDLTLHGQAQTFNFSSPLGGLTKASDIGLHVFTLNAGIQRGSFVETRCKQCKRFFLGCWSFKKNNADGKKNFGYRTDIECVGVDVNDDFFIMPCARRLYAVDCKLLRFITDALHFGGSTFTACVRVWAGQHPENMQQEMIHGKLMDQGRNTREYLSKAWFTWKALSLHGCGAGPVAFNLSEDKFDDSLLRLVPEIRMVHLSRTVEHLTVCEVCRQGVYAIGDGKQGAGRWICTGMDGFWELPELGVSISTGCTKHINGGQLFCKACRPSSTKPVALIPQVKVIEAIVEDDPTSLALRTMYLVECYDPDENGETFEAMLPRSEVDPCLLEAFERCALPSSTQHKGKLARPPRFKSARQKTLWFKGARGTCAPYHPKRQAASCKQHSISAASHNSWLKPSNADSSPIETCGIEKDVADKRRRRRTGGIFTAVLPCGWLADWMEIWRGEAIPLVYLFFLRLMIDLSSKGGKLQGIGYDNACKLLAFARQQRAGRPPFTGQFVDEILFFLDKFHKDNHTWCLKNMPEVNPESPEVAALIQHRNTEACEQLNAWISCHTLSALEMQPGAFAIYWWSLFEEHNAWVRRLAQANERKKHKHDNA